MKQIKTIRRMGSEDFDNEVNAALAEGWELMKRETLLIGTERSLLHCAEMEREIITKAEQSCENCKHRDDPPSSHHCIDCDTKSNWKWEAAE